MVILLKYLELYGKITIGISGREFYRKRREKQLPNTKKYNSRYFIVSFDYRIVDRKSRAKSFRMRRKSADVTVWSQRYKFS